MSAKHCICLCISGHIHKLDVAVAETYSSLTLVGYGNNARGVLFLVGKYHPLTVFLDAPFVEFTVGSEDVNVVAIWRATHPQQFGFQVQRTNQTTVWLLDVEHNNAPAFVCNHDFFGVHRDAGGFGNFAIRTQLAPRLGLDVEVIRVAVGGGVYHVVGVEEDGIDDCRLALKLSQLLDFLRLARRLRICQNLRVLCDADQIVGVVDGEFDDFLTRSLQRLNHSVLLHRKKHRVVQLGGIVNIVVNSHIVSGHHKA